MTAVIVLAAGKGTRFGTSAPKQFYPLNGKPVLAYSLETFERCAAINEVILVTAAADIDYCRREIADAYGFRKITHITAGGKERQDSVYNGLCLTAADIVLIHDAARPFVAENDVINLIEQTKLLGCCVLGVRAKDTVKVCNAANEVVQTPDRQFVWQMQTPQAFQASLIKEAHKQAAACGFYGTDDAMLTERIGYTTTIIEGSYDNFKITTQDDIALAENVLRRKQA